MIKCNKLVDSLYLHKSETAIAEYMYVYMGIHTFHTHHIHFDKIVYKEFGSISAILFYIILLFLFLKPVHTLSHVSVVLSHKFIIVLRYQMPNKILYAFNI